MVDKKYIKMGVAAMAVTALIIGLSVGITQSNKNNTSASASSLGTQEAGVYSKYDDSCSTGKSGKSGPTSPTGKSGKSGPTSPTGKSGKSNDRRQLYPGTEDFVEASPTQRRKLRADLINGMNDERLLTGKSGKSGPTSPTGKSGKSGPTSPSCGKSGKSNGGSGGDCAPTSCVAIFDPCATGKSGKSNGGGGKSGKSNGNGGSCGKSGKSNGSNPTDCTQAPTSAPTICVTTATLDTPAPVPIFIVETPEPTPEPTIPVTPGNSETVAKETVSEEQPWRGD